MALLVSEHMRMAADKLLRQRLDHIPKIERPLLLRHAGVKYDLKQEIAELFPEVVDIVALNRIGDFVRFLDRVRRDGRKVLFEIPRTAGFWRPQCRHDGE